MNKKVSIITPCYNGESYVARFLDSILAQTYDNIEQIVIDDGSTDRSAEIIESYRKKFEERGFRFIHLSQENKGLSVAVNAGLNVFTGEYLAWPDSDDYLSFNSIEKRVSYLESHPDVGMVFSKGQAVDFGTNEPLYVLSRKEGPDAEPFWKDLILGTNVYYPPAGYMVRSSMFRSVMPNPPQIEAPREIGQNYQMMIPMAYNYPVGQLDEILFYYSVRKDSLSHIEKPYEEHVRARKVANGVLKNIANRIENGLEKRREIYRLIDVLYWRSLLRLNVERGAKKESLEALGHLKSLRDFDYSKRSLALRIKHPFVHKLLRGIKHAISLSA